MRTATDGRVLRGERNRVAIVEALLSLLEEGGPKPSARAIAERAGVSLRSVFQHFDDMEALYAECVRQQFAKVAPLLEQVPAVGSVDERIAALVRQRAAMYERVAPIRRAAIAHASTSPALREGIERIAKAQRRQLQALLEDELDRADRREVLAALDAATSFECWEHLRHAQRLSTAAAERCMVMLVTGLLAKGAS